MTRIPGWPDELHSEHEQVKRIQSALGMRPEYMRRRKDGSYSIRGSGSTSYKVTLDSCTCPDFERRRKPCKHMYYLASKQGLLDDLPALKDPGDRSFRPADELERLRGLYESGDLDPALYVKLGDALLEVIAPKSVRRPRKTAKKENVAKISVQLNVEEIIAAIEQEDKEKGRI